MAESVVGALDDTPGPQLVSDLLISFTLYYSDFAYRILSMIEALSCTF